MADRVYNVLFICTGNSARSIMAEVLLNHWGRDKFKTYSAGSHPVGEVNPHTLTLLRGFDLPTEGLRSKSMNEFVQDGAPKFDFVFTVCDAAAETCPVFPGQPMTAHWGVPDPTTVSGSEAEIMQAYRDSFRMLERRIQIFVNLPIRALDKLTLQQTTSMIGDVGGHGQETASKAQPSVTQH